MGCVTSTLLNHDEEFPQIGGFSHHIVSLTSTTYGLLSLDPPPPPSSDSPPRKHGGSIRHQPLETINSWDLMSGLEENTTEPSLDQFLERFEIICPPRGEKRVVMYSTSLRGVRKTFEDCNAVRSAMKGLGISICERDISMDRGFREELGKLMKGRKELMIPPRVFVKGRYVGGVDEVMKIAEEGYIGKLVEGVPRLRGGGGWVCEGCGGVGFLPCLRCRGSCKVVVVAAMDAKTTKTKMRKQSVVMRCSDCNENGLVLCPICS